MDVDAEDFFVRGELKMAMIPRLGGGGGSQNWIDLGNHAQLLVTVAASG